MWFSSVAILLLTGLHEEIFASTPPPTTKMEHIARIKQNIFNVNSKGLPLENYPFLLKICQKLCYFIHKYA